MASNDVEVLDPAAPVEQVTEDKPGFELDRRHFFTALGVAGVAAAGAAFVSNKSAIAQQPTPNGFAQVDVLNLMLNVKYLKATLYSYITQGTDLPGSSLPGASTVTLGTGGVYNAPTKITFSSTQIADIFNEMYYDEVSQLIALRAILGTAAAPRQTINMLGTGPSGSAPSSTTTTLTQSQAIALSRLLEDLSASAFATATIYLTGTNLQYAAQALATDGLHAGAIRLLAIQNGVQYQGTQFASVATSNTAQAAVTFTGSLTAGKPLIYAFLGANVPAVGSIVTGIGIPPGAGAVITALTNTASATPTAITTKGSAVLTVVSSVSNLALGQPITGTNVPANSYISALGTNTITFTNPTAATASGSTTVSPTGYVTSGSATITGLSSVSGLIVGQVITGTGIPSGATILSPIGTTTITISAPATLTSQVVTTGSLTAGSPTVSGVSSIAGVIIGQPITGTGIAAGTNITAVTASSITMSANATASTPAQTVLFTGIATSGSAVLTAVSSVAGLAVGQLIAGTGIPVGATIASITSTSVTMSAKATASSTVTPVAITTSGSNILTSVSSVTGLLVGQAITGTGIPTGATIMAIGTTTVTMSANATATITSAETVTSPTPQTIFGGGQAINTPTTQTLTSPTTQTYTVGLSQVTIAGNATATGVNTYYIILADSQDVEPGDPGVAATSATGPSAIAGTSPAIYQGFFNTAGAATSSANTPPGFAFARTFQQILSVLYGYNPTNSVISTQNYEGGFYPVGVSGNINSTI